MAQDTIYVAVSSGVATVQGRQISFQEGKTYLLSGHPLLRECPGYFQALGEVLSWPPEKR